MIAEKIAAAEALKRRQENAEKRRRLAEVLAKKQDQKLEGMSEEDILKELAALDEAA